MGKHVKWQDKSFQTKPGLLVPLANLDLIEGIKVTPHQIPLPAAEYEAIEKGELTYQTREHAKARAYEMVRNVVWEKWSLPGEKIQEY